MTDIQIHGWGLRKFPDETLPRIHEFVLARRLGMVRERDIRNPFERLRKAGKFNDSDVRQVRSARGGAVKRTDPEYWYSERAALLVIGESNTPKAMDIRVEVMDVYLAVRAGLLKPPVPALPAPDRTWLLTYPEVGALKAQLMLVSKITGEPQGKLWRRARQEVGFRGYDIPHFLGNRILAWADDQKPRIALPPPQAPAYDGPVLSVVEVREAIQAATKIVIPVNRPRNPSRRTLGEHPYVNLYKAAGVRFHNGLHHSTPDLAELDLPKLVEWVKANPQHEALNHKP
jgi:hypothetical protein